MRNEPMRRNDLPETCFSILPSSGQLIIIRCGERGYYPSEWDTGKREENREIASSHNARRGITDIQEAAMLAGSIFGWNTPGANPQWYLDNAKYINSNIVQGHIKDPIMSVYYPINSFLLRYMTCYQQYNFLGETMYPEALACKSYLEIAETFLNRLQAQVEKVKAFRAARNVPYAVLGAEACLPPSEESLQGKLIVLRPTSLAPEYRTADCQLGFALSGFGCTPGARGRAVYFEELYSGERCRWDASDILGVANPEKIPDWAKEKLREYEQKRTEPKKDRGEAR